MCFLCQVIWVTEFGLNKHRAQPSTVHALLSLGLHRTHLSRMLSSPVSWSQICYKQNCSCPPKVRIRAEVHPSPSALSICIHVYLTYFQPFTAFPLCIEIHPENKCLALPISMRTVRKKSLFKQAPITHFYPTQNNLFAVIQTKWLKTCYNIVAVCVYWRRTSLIEQKAILIKSLSFNLMRSEVT